MKMEVRDQRRQRYIVLVPYPAQGHITPMLQLAHVLYARGFSIIVAHTEYNAPKASNHPEFDFLSLDDGIQDENAFANKLDMINVMMENCKVPFHDFLVKQVEEKGDNLACVVYDNIMSFVDQAATQLSLPTIVFRPFNAIYLQVLLHSLENEDSIVSIFPLEDSRLRDPIPGFDPLRYKDLPFTLGRSGVSEAAKEFLITSSDIKSSVAVIWNTVNDLEHKWLSMFRERYQVPIFPIGPLHKMALATGTTSLIEEDGNCLSWLDKKAPKSVVFVSTAGSLATTDEKDFEEIAWGLAYSEQPFLWVVRPGSIEGTEWKERLPEDFEKRVGDGGLIVKWAPQKEVLAHGSIGGFWSHCGWNSTLECLSEGIPMICKPHFVDQNVNSGLLVQEWKVGLELEKLEKCVIAETVRKLMVGDESKELRKRAMEMRQKIEISILENGNSCRALNQLVEFISSLPFAKIKKSI